MGPYNLSKEKKIGESAFRGELIRYKQTLSGKLKVKIT
jgi:hypothetical protein